MNNVATCKLCDEFQVPYPFDEVSFALMRSHLLNEHKDEVAIVEEDGKFVIKRKVTK